MASRSSDSISRAMHSQSLAVFSVTGAIGAGPTKTGARPAHNVAKRGHW